VLFVNLSFAVNLAIHTRARSARYPILFLTFFL
jgi:hypothetical protein